MDHKFPGFRKCVFPVFDTGSPNNFSILKLLATYVFVLKIVSKTGYYWDNRPDYYQNIALGYNYYVLYWERCIPFLLMLPKSIQ